MASGSEDIRAKVYRRVLRKGPGEFSVDGTMLSVLTAVDGRSSVADLEARLGLDTLALKRAVDRLLESRLIEPAEPEAPGVGQDFMDYLRGQLSLAVGPIAAFLVEDAAASLGQSVSRFPKSLVAELVDEVSREIRREEKRRAFMQNMLRKMKDNGY
jgi:hypothetical protein